MAPDKNLLVDGKRNPRTLVRSLTGGLAGAVVAAIGFGRFLFLVGESAAPLWMMAIVSPLLGFGAGVVGSGSRKPWRAVCKGALMFTVMGLLAVWRWFFEMIDVGFATSDDKLHNLSVGATFSGQWPFRHRCSR